MRRVVVDGHVVGDLVVEGDRAAVGVQGGVEAAAALGNTAAESRTNVSLVKK